MAHKFTPLPNPFQGFVTSALMAALCSTLILTILTMNAETRAITGGEYIMGLTFYFTIYIIPALIISPLSMLMLFYPLHLLLQYLRLRSYLFYILIGGLTGLIALSLLRPDMPDFHIFQYLCLFNSILLALIFRYIAGKDLTKAPKPHLE